MYTDPCTQTGQIFYPDDGESTDNAPLVGMNKQNIHSH